MKYPNLKKIIQPDISLIGLLITVYLANWMLSYIYIPDFQEYSAASLRVLPLNPLWLIISIFLITLLNILLMIQISSKYSIIRTKTFLPVFFFALFISVWQESHFLWSSHLALTAFLFSLMLFLGMYRNRKAVEPAFLGTFLISLTGLINPVYLFLIPVSWIGFTIMKSFSTKVFFASLMGGVVPWIFYFSYHLWRGNETHLFDNLLFDFQPYFLFSGRQLHEQVYIAITVIILIVGLLGFYTNLLSDTVQTRKNIHLILLYLIFMVLIIFSFAKNAFAFLPFIAFCLAILLSHPFSLNKSRLYPILFIFFISVNCVYVLLNYFIF